MNTKTCYQCKQEKPVTEFYKQPRNIDGLFSYCKACVNTRTKAYQKTPKGKLSVKRAAKRAAQTGNGIFTALQQSADLRSLPFTLTKEGFISWWHTTPDTCFYCKISAEEYINLRDFVLIYSKNNPLITRFQHFLHSPKHQAIQRLTIDRLDNTQGYTAENIVKSCWFCNSLKNNFFTSDEMELIAPVVTEKLKRAVREELAGLKP